MTGKDLLRTAAIKTARVWPCSAISRAIYREGVGAFGRLCSGYPEIEAAYTRNTFARGDWIAGLSDIDLTVVIRADLTRKAEFQFLTHFWTHYSHLTQRFPMLGEVDVLAEQELPLFQSCRLDHAADSQWILLYGRDVMRRHASSVSPRLRTRAVNEALWFYIERFLPSLAPPRTFLRQQDSSRLARKISRLCAAGSRTKSFKPRELVPDDPELLLASVHRRLERAAVSIMAGDIRQLDRNPSPPFGPCFDVRCNSIESICSTYEGRAFVILRDNLDHNAFAEAVRKDHALWAKLTQPPVFLSHTLATYYFRCGHPFDLARFERAGTVAFGANLLPLVPEPTDESLREVLLDQVRNTLLIPRDIRFFLTEEAVTAPELECALRVMTLPVIASRGPLASRSYEALLACARAEYSEEYQKIEQISSLPRHAARWQAFCVLRLISGSLLQTVRSVEVDQVPLLPAA